MIPACHNRPPLAGQWFRAGYKNGKIRLVWVPHRMSQPCKAWDSPDGYVTDPERLGWLCGGCRWIPERVKNLLAALGQQDVAPDCPIELA